MESGHEVLLAVRAADVAELLQARRCTELEGRSLKPELLQARRFLGWSRAECASITRQIQDLTAELAGSLSAEQQAIYPLNERRAEEHFLDTD